MMLNLFLNYVCKKNITLSCYKLIINKVQDILKVKHELNEVHTVVTIMATEVIFTMSKFSQRILILLHNCYLVNDLQLEGFHQLQ